MNVAATSRTRAEARLRRLPIPALRDVVNKQPSAGPNLAALDGIRGLAVLLVLASHTGAFHLRGHGGVGVWLFFALSAFLLTMPFAARPERAASWPHLRHYFARRLRRIGPAYYLFLAVEFAFVGDPDLPVILRHAVFLQGDSILWTIPQEVLFYLALPLLAASHLFLFRRSSGVTMAGLAALALFANLHIDTSVFAM